MLDPSVGFTGPRSYDEEIGPYTFAPFARELAGCLPQGFDGELLELACGTGLVTRELRRRMAPTARLVATDLNPGMLAFARERLEGEPIEWHEANALSLPFETASFDGIACGLGLMFLPDRAAALREWRRVLRPGGQLMLTVWDRIEENPHALVFAQIIETLFPGDAEMRFRTPYELCDAAVLDGLLAGAGFGERHIETRRIAIRGADPRRIASGQIRGTPRGALIAARGLAIEEVVARVAQGLAAQGGDPYDGYCQGLVVQARALPA
ncbi:methyltransferase domain-containing protein [Ramlibacter henchirensis]|uniref:Methyltransferase domain-containing protein n=1 Tax=Ramlibacter henchirensis TaxID=204072 RepID=A0A4Z0C9C6_9BURK|nr:methyltransferase domain-containing protein [Ramlibacter henchirensis]TFZ07018.1 methyltransferase domain-containing protein [Ramlibacter henchirensis]